MSEDKETSGMGNVVRIDDERNRNHLGQIVRGTVEDTLNSLLEAVAERLCNVARYEWIAQALALVPGVIPNPHDRFSHAASGHQWKRV